MELAWSKEIQEALAAPFPEDEIDFLPRSPGNGRALALPYIDARSVMRRLDAVVGPANWWFDFEVLSPDGKQVKGRLTVLGVTKCDAGEAGDEEEALKSAVSDALKRCAVHFGIGRYLYYLPKIWAPYDSARRRFAEPPRWPAGAMERALAVCGYAAGAPPAMSPRPEAASALNDGEGPETSIPHARRPHVGGGGGRAAGGDATGLACSNAACGKSLTRGQYEVSLRGFGRPLCPTCQRQAARIAA